MRSLTIQLFCGQYLKTDVGQYIRYYRLIPTVQVTRGSKVIEEKSCNTDYKCQGDEHNNQKTRVTHTRHGGKNR